MKKLKIITLVSLFFVLLLGYLKAADPIDNSEFIEDDILTDIVSGYDGGTISDVKLSRNNKGEDNLLFTVDKPFVAEIKLLNLPYRMFIDIPMPYKWEVSEETLNQVPVTIIEGFRYSNPSEEVFRVTLDLTKRVFLRKAYVRELVDPSVQESVYSSRDINVQQDSQQAKDGTKKLYEFGLDFSPTGKGSINNIPGSNSVVFADNKEVLTKISSIADAYNEKEKKQTRGQALEYRIKDHLSNVQYKKPTIDQNKENRPVRIFIDPGHGGKDPGAISQDGTIQEKELVLMVSKALKEQLQQNPEISVILSRDGDYYIPLKDRILWAQHMKANVFISIHADKTIGNADASGLSLYSLSEVATDAQTQVLANSENRSDLAAGINLSNEDSEVNQILVSLSQRVKANESINLARSVIEQVSKSTKILPNPIRSADFAVLKLPSTPSLLVELGFLSNIKDVREFTNANYPDKISISLSAGLEYYLWQKGELTSFPADITAKLNTYVDTDIYKAIKEIEARNADIENAKNEAAASGIEK